METVLVIGGAGLVGSHVARAFSRERVVATYHADAFRGGVHLDMTDASAVGTLTRSVRPRTIVLAAGEAWVDRCEREPEQTRRLNVESARYVVDAARTVDAKVVVFSTDYVFDGVAGPYAENDPVAPINEYGRQKVALEEIARGLPHHIVCRTSGVFGRERAGKNFVCQLTARLRAAQPFNVPLDQVITPTYAPDLAKAVVELVRVGATGTFNVVGPEVMQRIEFARLAAEILDLPVHLIAGRSSSEMGYLALRPQNAGLSDSRLRRTLGHSLRSPDASLRDLAGVTRPR